MNHIKYIFRGIFIVLAIVLLFYINKKPDDNVESIAEFKFKMFQKLQADSLNSKQKAGLLLKETTKFVDDSSRVQRGIQYLMGLLALVAIMEVSFFIMNKRNSRSPDIN